MTNITVPGPVAFGFHPPGFEVGLHPSLLEKSAPQCPQLVVQVGTSLSQLGQYSLIAHLTVKIRLNQHTVREVSELVNIKTGICTYC